jgi:tyrosyl-tRNA synthetase
MTMNLYDELLAREAVAQITDDALITQLNTSSLTFYLGIDPTGDSLHVGHLFGLINCRRLQNAGHTPVLLVGGATGMIGDPSGKSAERNLLDQAAIDHNVASLNKQITKLIDAKMVNNYDWTKSYDVISFLRDIGKHFSINTMIAKDSVKSRLDSGISYTEFSYQVLQALDYYHLYKDENVRLQVGGTEQWGNITAGLDLIRRILAPKEPAFGLCWDLITKSDGTKFGKTEQGAVWLDKDKTSPYEFYQFWFNTPDADAIKYLYKFTFYSLDEIRVIEEQMRETPHLRHAQKALGQAMVELVHSKADMDAVLATVDQLFEGDVTSMTLEQMDASFANVPRIHASEINIIDALVETTLASSKREARTFIDQGGVQVNGVVATSYTTMLSKNSALHSKYTIMKRGKKRYGIVEHS